MTKIHYKPKKHTFVSEVQLRAFVKKEKIDHVHDFFETMWKEREAIDKPDIYFLPSVEKAALLEEKYRKFFGSSRAVSKGVWIHHPWSSSLFHLVSEQDYYTLRTARNRDLVSAQQQEVLHKACISVIGLSVGSCALMSLVRYGIGSTYIIGDYDNVEVSNLNRSMYGLSDYLTNKTDALVKKIFELDPFAQVIAYTSGIDEKSMGDILKKADLVIDTFDSFGLKVKLREMATQLKKPIISGFDIEKGMLLLVERYDIDSEKAMNVFLNGTDPSILFQPTSTPQEKTNFFIKLIGKKYHSPLMLKCVLGVGKVLTGYPQLVIATQLTASIFTMVAEDILLKKSQRSYRKHYDLTS